MNICILIGVFISHRSFAFLPPERICALDHSRMVQRVKTSISIPVSVFVARLFRLYPRFAAEQIAETQDQYNCIYNVRRYADKAYVF